MATCGHWPPERIAAGVVLYHPREQARRLIDVLADQFEAVFAVENEARVVGREYDDHPNGSLDTSDNDRRAVHMQRNSKNAGLARAINQVCESARAEGFEWLVLFDQDSGVPPDFRARFARLFPTLAESPALLAANYHTVLCDEMFPGYRLDGNEPIGERVTDLNAGSLLDLQIHRQVGGHCEALFVDHVDHEYCLRLRRNGYAVLATREPLFTHEIGNIVCARRFGRVWQSGGHPPSRRREASEALVRVIKSYWRFEPRWCSRMLLVELPRSIVAMLVLERQRVAKLSALAAGLARGIFRSKSSVR